MDLQGIALKGRTLWQDGSSTATDMNYLYDRILSGADITELFVTEVTPEVKTYNRHTRATLGVKQTMRSLSFAWNIPEEYKKLSVNLYVLKKLEQEIESNNFSNIEIEQRLARTQLELDLWDFNDMSMLFVTLIYIIDQLVANNVVWGTGRGSSCACYILYLIGLHDVDSVYYNLDIKEFFRN